MNPELQKALVDLAAKLGVTVDHLWGVLLYQAKIEAAFDGLIFVLCAAYFIGGVWLFRRAYLRLADDFDHDDSNWWFGLFLFCAVGLFLFCAVGILVLMIMIAAAHGFITETVNPEFWALKQIIGE